MWTLSMVWGITLWARYFQKLLKSGALARNLRLGDTGKGSQQANAAVMGAQKSPGQSLSMREDIELELREKCHRVHRASPEPPRCPEINEDFQNVVAEALLEAMRNLTRVYTNIFLESVKDKPIQKGCYIERLNLNIRIPARPQIPT